MALQEGDILWYRGAVDPSTGGSPTETTKKMQRSMLAVVQSCKCIRHSSCTCKLRRVEGVEGTGLCSSSKEGDAPVLLQVGAMEVL